uniref:MMPL domain-containing protein n=1 Tax=Loa loa TaxID=7209 RepID=A0A1I7V8W5_LOALO
MSYTEVSRSRTAIYILFEAVLLYPIMMLAAVPFAIGSLVFLIPVSTAYCIIAIIKCIPAFSRACDVIYLMSMLAGCFGLDQWRIILRENYEANRQHEIKIAQEEEELSESSKSTTALKNQFAIDKNDRLITFADLKVA